MGYIRRVRVDDPGTSNRHITAVKYSVATFGDLYFATRQQIVNEIDSGRVLRTHNDATGKQARVIAATSETGLRYITTEADGRETNNLLNLPRF